jgi:hypothetical protein
LLSAGGRFSVEPFTYNADVMLRLFAVIRFHNNKFHLVKRSVLLTQYCSGGKIEKNEMGRTCSAYGLEERFIQGFGGKT